MVIVITPVQPQPQSFQAARGWQQSKATYAMSAHLEHRLRLAAGGRVLRLGAHQAELQVVHYEALRSAVEPQRARGVPAGGNATRTPMSSLDEWTLAGIQQSQATGYNTMQHRSLPYWHCTATALPTADRGSFFLPDGSQVRY